MKLWLSHYPPKCKESLPAGERGLKYRVAQLVNGKGASVAPRRGAWIEMCLVIDIPPVYTSLPAGERGLKSLLGNDAENRNWSLPAGERGLKYSIDRIKELPVLVAPRRGSVD